MIATKEHVVPGAILYTTGADQYGNHPWLEIIKVLYAPEDRAITPTKMSFTFTGVSRNISQPLVLDAELVDAILTDLSTGKVRSRTFHGTDYALDFVAKGRYNLYHTYTELHEAQDTFRRLRDKEWTEVERRIIDLTNRQNNPIFSYSDRRKPLGTTDELLLKFLGF